MRIRKRKIVIASPVITGSDTVTLTLTYSGAAPATAAAFYPSKYNKPYAINLQKDDGYLGDYDNAYAYLVGGVTASDNTTYPGKSYTDGTGHAVKPRMSFALPATGVRNNTQTSFAQYQQMIAQGSGIINHSHGSELQTADRAAWIMSNEQAIYDNIGIRTRFFVIPSSDEGFSISAKNLNYLGVGSSFAPNTEDGQTVTWGAKVAMTEIATRPTILYNRAFVGDTWGSSSTVNEAKVWVDNMYATAGFCVSMFSHGPNGSAELAGWKTLIDYIFSHGTYNDNVWFADAQELLEYYEVIRKGIKSEQISGNVKTITVNLSALDKNQRWKDFSLNAGAGLTNVTVNGADSVTFNASTGLVNVYKKNTVFTNPNLDVLPPSITSVTVYNSDPSTLYIKYNQGVTQSLLAAYAVDNNTVTALTGSGDLWKLTLQTAITTGQTIKFNYRAQNGNALQSTDSTKKVSSYIAYPVVNNVGNTSLVPPSGTNPSFVASGLSYNSERVVLADPTATGTIQTGVLPFQEKWMWQENSPSLSISQLITNTNASADPVSHFGQIFSEYDTYIDYPVNAQCTITSFDYAQGFGSFAGRNLKVYGIKPDNTEVLIWTQPDTVGSQFTNLNSAVTSIVVKRLRIHVTGNGFPIYLHPKGAYYNTTEATLPTPKLYPLRNQLGINTQYWSWEEGNNSWNADTARVNRMKDFTGWNRVYFEWNKIEPTALAFQWETALTDGGWSEDAILNAAKANNIMVYACLNSVPNWIKTTYDGNNSTDTRELAPIEYGRDRQVAANYDKNARLAYQFAARYENNTTIPLSKVYAETTPAGVWQGAPYTQKRVGLGVVAVVENENERDKWWKGRVAYQTGRERAANDSAFYDGHKGTMGDGYGVKTADPSMIVMMGGLASWSADYYLGYRDWVIEQRGYKGDGTINFPCDIIAFHYYQGSAEQYSGSTGGICSEKAVPSILQKADVWNDFRYRKMNGIPSVCNEFGYDKNITTDYSAPAIGSKTSEVVAADWEIRALILFSAKGVLATASYLHADDAGNAGAVFSAMGKVKSDLSRFASLNYYVQVDTIMGAAIFDSFLSEGISDKFILKFKAGSQDYYIGWLGTMTGATGTYNIPFTAGTSITLYTLSTGSTTPTTQNITTTGTFYTVAVSETPVFIKVN